MDSDAELLKGSVWSIINMLARDDAELLQEELIRLDEWLGAQQFDPVYDHIIRIRKKLLSGLKYSAYLADYLEDAIAVNAVLTDRTDEIALDTLLTRSKNSIGSSIPERKAMGVALAVLGIGLLVLSVLLMSTVIACSFPLAGFFMVLAGTASVTFSFGLFRSGLQGGMAKELDELHQALLQP